MRKKPRKQNTEKSIELECIPSLHIMQSRSLLLKSAPAEKTRHKTWKCSMCFRHDNKPKRNRKELIAKN